MISLTQTNPGLRQAQAGIVKIGTIFDLFYPDVKYHTKNRIKAFQVADFGTIDGCLRHDIRKYHE